MSDQVQGALLALAGNMAAPSSVLLRLLAVPDRRVRNAVAQRENLPPQVVEAILAHPELEVRQIFGESPNADPTQRARLLDDLSADHSLVLALGPQPYRKPVEPLPDWAYARLLTHPRAIVRRETLASPTVPPHILAALADHADPAFRKASCRAWDDLPHPVREALLHDDNADVRLTAQLSVLCPDEQLTTQLLADLADSWRIPEVLARGKLSPKMAESLISDGKHLRAIAANLHIPPDLVERMATSSDPYVRLIVSARPELTEEDRAAIDYTVDPQTHLPALGWVLNANEEPDILRRCATSAHPWLRRSAAACPGLPQDMVELLARDEDFAVRLLLCESQPTPPPELLLDLYLGRQHRAAQMLITHPGFPTQGLAARFGHSPDPVRRRLALRDPALDPLLLDRLSRDLETQEQAAQHPHLPVARIKELLANPAPVPAAARNPSLPPSAMHELLDRTDTPL
ncbi:hypothetical protein AMK16_30210 [Streptomyces sp. CB00455]|uniref:hypothetical protein n=1 Tax=Streptomyces sp. CB00455 TaxID=1703927 RepID=UPI00093EE9A2|nr:hypothetical protein [Streptomyces sp. CB00455]OKK14801.1 hypothetical protein AMK16_30210 [Streptomyces sp. CB00455]